MEREVRACQSIVRGQTDTQTDGQVDRGFEYLIRSNTSYFFGIFFFKVTSTARGLNKVRSEPRNPPPL